MNARDYKIFRAGCYYHVYNRGNNKEDIFIDAQDYFIFLKRIQLVLGKETSKTLRIRSLPKEAFTIICYCLMPNHFHFVIKQNTDIEINKLLSRVCTSYSKYFNKKYQRVGHVFQDTFKAKLVQNDSYLTYLSAYIHKNPIKFESYDFSSYKDYIGLRAGKLCDKSFLLSIFQNDSLEYKKFVFAYSSRDEDFIKKFLFEE